MLCLIKQKTVEFCCNSNGEKWQQANIKFKLEIGVESFRDAVMIPIHKAIVIFHMRNAVAISVTILDLDNVGSENLLLPHDVHCANLALLCMFNDKIYCFARTGQQRFHMFVKTIVDTSERSYFFHPHKDSIRRQDYGRMVI